MIFTFFLIMAGLVGLGAWIFYTFKWTEKKQELERAKVNLQEKNAQLELKNKEYDNLFYNYKEIASATEIGLQTKNDTLQNRLDRSTDENIMLLDSVSILYKIYISQKDRLEELSGADKTINDLKGKMRADRYKMYVDLKRINDQLDKQIRLITKEQDYKRIENGAYKEYKKLEEELK